MLVAALFLITAMVVQVVAVAVRVLLLKCGTGLANSGAGVGRHLSSGTSVTYLCWRWLVVFNNNTGGAR
jgi:hypothetical protein